MRFHHAPQVWAAHPSLSAGVVHASGITANASMTPITAGHLDVALQRLAERPVSEFPEIKAWRRTFSAMGLKPTQYRCAAESLLRRLSKERSLPEIHPLVDLYNHVSVRAAIPIGAFDVARVAGALEVRPATGDERYLAFSGDVERPSPGEVIFADQAGAAHARRWSHRQSAASAIRDDTHEVLIVVEAMHQGAAADVTAVVDSLSDAIGQAWGVPTRTAVLTAADPVFDTSE